MPNAQRLSLAVTSSRVVVDATAAPLIAHAGLPCAGPHGLHRACMQGEHAHDVYTLTDPPSPGVYRGPTRIKVVAKGFAGED